MVVGISFIVFIAGGLLILATADPINYRYQMLSGSYLLADIGLLLIVCGLLAFTFGASIYFRSQSNPYSSPAG